MKQTIALIIFTVFILLFSLRGSAGNPTGQDINSIKWRGSGVFELSPERGRFALLYSVLENKTVFFTKEIAEFASPDVGFHNGRYVSLFAPFLSFIVAPGYIIGKHYQLAQVGAYAVVTIFALMNFWLVKLIARSLGADKYAATIAAIIFLFATPAYAYAVNLYQHHVSTFFILLSIFALLVSNRLWVFLTVFFLCGAAIPLDYPNLFLMFPIGVYAIFRTLDFRYLKERLLIRINFLKILTVLVMIVPISLFLYFNYLSYGDYFRLSGTVETIKFDPAGNVDNLESAVSIEEATEGERVPDNRSPVGFFTSRALLNGLYTHFVSPDRGIIYYAPIILFGFVGLIVALKKKITFTPLLFSITSVNILLYSMWGDPWGGWAFGSRYLIPSYAILSIFIALLLTFWRKKSWLFILFIPVAFYSIAVNTLGAITTSALPPKIEVLQLEKLSGMVQKYNYARNWDFLLSGHSKSFFYQEFLRNYLSPVQFYQLLTVAIFLFTGFTILHYLYTGVKKEDKND